jgi:hypothetical protein
MPACRMWTVGSIFYNPLTRHDALLCSGVGFRMTGPGRQELQARRAVPARAESCHAIILPCRCQTRPGHRRPAPSGEAENGVTRTASRASSQDLPPLLPGWQVTVGNNGSISSCRCGFRPPRVGATFHVGFPLPGPVIPSTVGRWVVGGVVEAVRVVQRPPMRSHIEVHGEVARTRYNKVERACRRAAGVSRENLGAVRSSRGERGGR